ncbi:hypothetical protein CTI12_AA062380 [Artemisia annua]|uniref:Neprosin PEP catalytic domain-containing protein n=1 Tax=Artemisia annua TaxID=35608 RepID=A0A2U1Q8R7_ARTAN|nr:hypothetical protein CTI12_AA062380 [Artemisia annua]
MVAKAFHEMSPLIFILLLLCFMLNPILSKDIKDARPEKQSFEANMKSQNMKLIKNHLQKINKPFVKSIQASLKSPDGDTIDCVLFHHQPAFDLPEIRRTMPLVLPELPTRHNKSELTSEVKQLWNSNGESCPIGTIPIRRTSESDILRFSSFGKKLSTFPKEGRRSEHAVAYVKKACYGARGKLNIWAPKVTNKDEFSLSQIWVTNDAGPPRNTIEAGWMVYQELNGDTSPRLFIYWTNDGYNKSGCYNLMCSGFVQTNQKISLGAAVTPISSYNGPQYEIDITIWKDPKGGNWWLVLGHELIASNLIGYWPSSIFEYLRDHANLIEFGGEVLQNEGPGAHTSTQMGSGHFASEAYGKASFVRNMELVDKENHFIPMSDESLYAERPECYNVQSGCMKKNIPLATSNRYLTNALYFSLVMIQTLSFNECIGMQKATDKPQHIFVFRMHNICKNKKGSR